MIQVRNLTKKYGNNIAVDDLSFSIEKGKIYGLLGPNGAGKSSVMNIITGYIAATEGEVIINGHDILKEPAAAKSAIGYLPEIPPLYMEMTVREYLKFAAELKKIPKGEIDVAVDMAEDITHISDVSHRLIKNLSKGYRQRVGLAQAVIGLPEVLILDEPTVGLDPKQIIEIRDLIKNLGKQHTVILSSHILSEVSAVCDHVMIISKGKLVASEPTEELLAKAESLEDIFLELTAEEPVVADESDVEEPVAIDESAVAEKLDVEDVPAAEEPAATEDPAAAEEPAAEEEQAADEQADSEATQGKEAKNESDI